MIRSVEFFNWKCFAHLEVPFSAGMNFITGPNGAGKSSILQAISVAFTGQVPDGLELRNFIRKNTESAKILLAFERGDELLYIQRNLSTRGREKCSILDSKTKEAFAGSWDEVTEYVEDLLKIRALLFTKLFFMSEGDVYRTVNEPPGKQLLDEIDRLLGIVQMQALVHEVIEVKQEFQKDLLRQLETLGKVEIAEETAENRHILESKLLELQGRKGKKSMELDQLTRESWELKDDLKKFDLLLDDLLLLEREKETLAKEKEKSDSLRRKLEETLKEIDLMTHEKLVAEADVSNFGKIIDVIGETKKTTDASVKCPVCKRPISIHEIDEIRKEAVEHTKIKERKIADCTERLKELDLRRRSLELELRKLEERETRIQILGERHRGQTVKVEDVQRKKSETLSRIKVFQERMLEDEQALRKIESEIGDLRERLGRSDSFDLYKSGIAGTLMGVSKGCYISDFTLRGLEKLISKQRDSKLREKLYSSISEVWNSFKGERGWIVKLDQSALPSIELESQVYPFHMLSAGEKTALLVVTRTILSTLFARDVDFLLLDEPLEHLDARNRHSLLQFLVDVLKERLVKQLIVTTTEYSLLRKFIDYKDVKILPLDSLSPLQAS